MNYSIPKNFKKIEDDAMKIETGIIDDFEQYCIDKSIEFNKWSNDKYNKEFNKYARDNHDRYLKQYQDKMNEYFDIIFI